MRAPDSSLRSCTSREKLCGVQLRERTFKKIAKLTSRRLHFQNKEEEEEEEEGSREALYTKWSCGVTVQASVCMHKGNVS
jgi:hypothetical protein